MADTPSPDTTPPPPGSSGKKIFFRVPPGYFDWPEEQQLAWCQEALTPLFPDEA